jgi:sec-independent protein translocase protein TatA
VGNLGATELIIIAVVVILLFGAKKMPDMARSLGRSMRIIKAETKGLRQDGHEDDEAGPAPTTTATQAATPAVPPPAQLSEAKQQSDIDKMQKQIDELQQQLKANSQQAAQPAEPTQAQKNAS